MGGSGGGGGWSRLRLLQSARASPESFNLLATSLRDSAVQPIHRPGPAWAKALETSGPCVRTLRGGAGSTYLWAARACVVWRAPTTTTTHPVPPHPEEPRGAHPTPRNPACALPVPCPCPGRSLPSREAPVGSLWASRRLGVAHLSTCPAGGAEGCGRAQPTLERSDQDSKRRGTRRRHGQRGGFEVASDQEATEPSAGTASSEICRAVRSASERTMTDTIPTQHPCVHWQN